MLGDPWPVPYPLSRGWPPGGKLERTMTRRFVCVLALAATACGGGGAAGVEITAEQFGDSWPFTVERGQLSCAGASAIVFTADGTEYAVNEAAREAGYAALDPVWRSSPIIPALKVSVAPVIERGLDLCG